MKALISPNEIRNYSWISSWNLVDGDLVPVYSSLDGTQRVAQVAQSENIFEVADPLYWIDCPDDCVADVWAYKDGSFVKIPKNEPKP